MQAELEKRQGEKAEGKTDEEIYQEAVNAATGTAQNKQWRSQAVNDTYEPGSTFKALVLAAALEEGVVSESDTFYCPGYYMVEGLAKAYQLLQKGAGPRHPDPGRGGAELLQPGLYADRPAAGHRKVL